MDWNFIGNQNIVDYLQKNLIHSQLAHGYLFYGPEHIGKTKLAQTFMAAILCHAYQADKDLNPPCQKCLHCQQLAKGIHPDVYWVKREEGKKDITIEQINELRGRLGMSSFLNSYKIAVIEEAEKMNRSAANALLKTLEEPTPHTILILLTSKINFLPATIASRCQVLRFKPVPLAEILNFLIKLKASRPLAEIIANLSFGCPGKAVNFLQNEGLLSFYQAEVNDFLEINRQDISYQFKEIASLVKDGENFSARVNNLIAVLDIWQLVLRDLLLIKIFSVNLIKNIFIQKELERLATKYSINQLKELIDKIRSTQKYLRQNINPQLAMENLVLNF